MYRLTSANHLRSLFTAAAAPYRRRLLRLNPPLRSFASTYSSRRPPPPPATDLFRNIAGKDKIRGDDGGISERKVLPPKLLSENVAMLTCESSADGGICHVYLIGTCHYSPESRREVKAVIQFLKPQVVFLELCPSRFTVGHNVGGRSTVQPASTLHEKPNIDWNILKGMTDVQDAESEFMEAYKQAMQYGARVILGDRPIEITRKRIAANISKWDLIKALWYTNFHREGLRDKMWSSMFPSTAEPILHERDQYMSSKILEVASKHNSVVAVVGKAHLVGIQKNWKQPVELERLLSVPTEKNRFAIPLILLAVAVAWARLLS